MWPTAFSLSLVRHRFHALCPYFAMFPEAFAREQVERYTDPGDLVLDPFSGRGTAPFQSLLMGREAAACDVNPVAYTVTRAKTNAPPAQAVLDRLDEAEGGFDPSDYDAEADGLPPFFRRAYAPYTLRQVLHLRALLDVEADGRAGDIDAMVAALTLEVLHGESHKTPSCLSNRMPRTISTKPAYSVRYWDERGLDPPERDAFAVLRNRVAFRYRSARPEGRAHVWRTDMRGLPSVAATISGRVRLIVTSPPYLDVTNFEEDQWLRLWFLGGPPEPTRKRISPDDRHYSEGAYWPLLRDFFRTVAEVAAEGAHVVVRIGGKGLTPDRLAEGLEESAEAVEGRSIRPVGPHRVSAIKGRQTAQFRPGSRGCLVEVDHVFAIA